ncbi:NIPSNAP family protein [Rhodohalobacter sp. 8-1]|uniref:NIPSNAP family protein n=1 Tax=Rhodohalobacter sp. 8-1 TaxID=3131972 RepID=UPI0030EE3FB0
MKIKLTLFLFAITLSCLLTGCSGADGAESQASETETVIYELRTYTTHEGKLSDLHNRFEKHTMDLFEKHGMTNVMYWSPETPDLKDNTLIYLLSHESREAAEQSWEGFLSDPEWQNVYETSREDGPIVQRVESIFMNKTPYSP